MKLIDRLSRSLSGSAPPLRAVVVNTIKHTEPGEAKRPEAKRPEAERPEAEHDTGNTGAEGSRDTGAKEARTPQAGEAKYQHNHPRDIPEMPDPSELDFKEKEGPIRVVR